MQTTATPHHKPQPYPTLSQLLHNQTRPNSVCNLISTLLEDSCSKKLGQPPDPPPKKKKIKIQILFGTNSKLNSTKFSMPPYFNQTRRFMPKKIGSAPLPKKIKTRLPGAVPQPIGLFLFCIEFDWG